MSAPDSGTIALDKIQRLEDLVLRLATALERATDMLVGHEDRIRELEGCPK